MVKKCPKCGIDKELDLFHKAVRTKSGFTSYCKDCNNAVKKEYRKNNKSKIKSSAAKYYIRNKIRINAYNKEYARSHSYAAKKQAKEYRDKNSVRCREVQTLYKKVRRQTDVNYRLTENLKRRVRAALFGKPKGKTIERNFGYDGQLREYIETTFTDGMSWSNYGNSDGCWSIDHILPISSFDLTDSEQLKQANHYTNLRAMWHIDNLLKGNKLL